MRRGSTECQLDKLSQYMDDAVRCSSVDVTSCVVQKWEIWRLCVCACVPYACVFVCVREGGKEGEDERRKESSRVESSRRTVKVRMDSCE